ITAGGFQTARTTRPIGMDQHFQPRIVLQTVAGATVEVIASSMTTVDPTSVQAATNYDASHIDELPMGRSPNNMSLLTPGVTTGVGGRVQVRGAMTSGNLYLLDGQNVADNKYGTLGAHFIDSSYEETQVITGAISAEYGNVDGGVINTITKSGGNVFSGEYRVEMTNPAWNAVRPGQNRAAIRNILSEFKTYSLGGFFLKDKLWFHVAMYETESSATGIIAGNAAGPSGAGAGYTTSQTRDYITGKLTFMLNQDHTIIGAYSTNEVKVKDSNNYGAGEIWGLVDQTEESSWYNLSWRAIWTPVLNTEIRFGARTQDITAGPNRPGISPTNLADSPIRPANNGYRFMNAGVFGGTPTTRENQTANLKGSYFANWYGSHEIDFGIDYYKGTVSGKNSQSHTDYTYIVAGFDAVTRMVTLNPNNSWVQWWFGEDASADKVSYGFYINDKWKLNDNWAFQIGVRWDTYSATATDFDGTIASASGISPRLGVTYDLFGDQKWIFKASWCQYHANVMESVTSAVSMSENVGRIDMDYSGPTGSFDLTAATNLANYTILSGYDNPIENIQLDSGLKAPTVDEMQIGVTYSYETEQFGKGYVSLTYITRDWKNMLDYAIGNQGKKYIEELGEEVFIERWWNEPLAKRKYTGLELQTAYNFGNLDITGSVTWSSLEGNYEGEGSSSPGTGQGMNYFRVVDNVVMYDSKELDPVGNLAGDRPLVMRWTANYSLISSIGRTTFGFIYSFDSGTPYGYGRNLPVATLNPNLPREYGLLWSQSMDNKRTHGRYNSEVYHDVSVTQDFNLFKVKGVQVRAFAKLIIYNFFNHRQLITWNIGAFNQDAQGNNLATDRDTPWVPGPNFGTFSAANYGTPRSYRLAVGVRF
ncbi:MAG: TonB-dependent receptor, partial [Holophagales bacterium]|nr:TonB-dependent receptor [Holophagales bacterium]